MVYRYNDNEEALCQAHDLFIMENPTFNDTFTYANIREAAMQCTRGVKWKPSVQNFIIDNLQWTAELYKKLFRGTYKSMGFIDFWLVERAKKRHIQSVHISERTVQKCLTNNAVKPVIEPSLIYDNSASLKGKGQFFAMKRCRKHLASHYRRYGRTGGFLVIDLHDYFNSIRHKELLEIHRKALTDDRLYNLTKYFIDCFEGDVGLGLGSELSQISAIAFLNKADHYIKEHLHIKEYARYMDDMYLGHWDISYLKYCFDVIKSMFEVLGLTINPKSKIIRIDKESLIFLKHRYSLTDTGRVVTRLLPGNITKRRRILKRQKRLVDEGKADIHSIRQSYASWRGYARKWQSRRSVANMDILYFNLFGDGGTKAEQKYFKEAI